MFVLVKHCWLNSNALIIINYFKGMFRKYQIYIKIDIWTFVKHLESWWVLIDYNICL